ncbi:MAG: serine/threonine protein kinase [Polyangiaceae bacterium]|nr:serine/threonine protein kinase [Polyangiaceae bacterium]
MSAQDDPNVIGKYRLLATLGRGGMAEVFLAISQGPAGFSKLVVLKELRAELATDPDFLSMFMDEARLAARLRHPNVVQTNEVGEEAGRLYIAMEYLDGQPLSRVLSRMRGQLPLPLHLRVIAETLTGLHYAHELRDFDGTPLAVVHRDVTPHNVFVTYGGEVKLVDFGIAKATDSSTETRTGVLKGKAGYMAPEQAMADRVDRRADVFSAGVMLWEALVGQRMWRGLNDVAIVGRLLRGQIPSAAEARPDLPEVVLAVLGKALAPDPADRYASAEELRLAVEQLARQAGPTPTARQLGELVGQVFAEERERLREVIEAQIRRLREAGSSSALRAAELPPLLDRTAPHAPVDTGPSGTGSAVRSVAAIETEAARDETPTVPPPRVRRARARVRAAVAAVGGVAAVAGAAVAWQRIAAPGAGAGGMGAERRVQSAGLGACADPNRPLVELSGDVESDATLSCDKKYLIKFRLVVPSGVTLTIEKGTVLEGDVETKGVLVVQPGGKLRAVGTRDEPVVFTSSRPPGSRRAGDWGGVVLLGRAPINLRDAEGRSTRGRVEGIPTGGWFGGSDPDDDSGQLAYVRIEYAGTELGPGNEVNGLTLAGVGRRTRLSHIQVRHASDDCFEFFGGTVDAKHLACQYNGDDGIDWDYGWTGRLQFVVVQQDPSVHDDTHGFEGDNDPSASTNEPVSAPTIYNATLCGKNRDVPKEQYGMLLRRGTRARIANAVVVGFDAGLDVRDAPTQVDVRSSIFFGNLRHAVALTEDGRSGDERDDDGALDEIAWVLDPARRNSTGDPRLARCFDPDDPDFAPRECARAGWLMAMHADSVMGVSPASTLRAA